MRRLVNAVFDLQKDIGKLDKKMANVDKNIELLRDQFQDFAEKTQSQLGVMIPSRQFQTDEENQAAEIEADVKALEKEIKSVQQLRDHIEERHSSGAMPKDTYTEQAEKLDTRLQRLNKNLEKKRKELEKLIE
jgi:prefoldin subunit 5